MKRISLSIVSIALLCLCTVALAAPKKDLWPRWQVNDPLSKKTIDYKPWAGFLKDNVHTNAEGINLVAYANVTPFDKKILSNFLRHISSIHIDTYNRREQEVYWINLYNALTIATVLKHYPIKSILDIKISGWFEPGPWGAKLIKIEGIPVSLNDIEHRILRPIWNDQRLHYALNCASMSCPNLQKQPYTSKNLTKLLNTAATEYVNSNYGTEVKNDKLIVSSIYVWYKEDFGGTDDDVIDFLGIYAKPPLKDELIYIKKINGNRYNWALNLWTAPKKQVTDQKLRKVKKHRRHHKRG